jgi:hypothetical protein
LLLILVLFIIKSIFRGKSRSGLYLVSCEQLVGKIGRRQVLRGRILYHIWDAHEACTSLDLAGGPQMFQVLLCQVLVVLTLLACELRMGGELPLALLSIEGALDLVICDPCSPRRIAILAMLIEVALLLGLILLLGAISDKGIFRGNVRAVPHEVCGGLHFIGGIFQPLS